MCPSQSTTEEGVKSIPCEVVDNMLWRQSIGKRVDELSDRQVEMSAQLQENTESTRRIEVSTQELVNILESWKGAMRVLELVGKVTKPIGMIATAAAAIWGLLHLGGPK